jgi:Nuclease-related domain
MSDVVAARETFVPRSRFARFFGASPLSPEMRPLYRAALGEVLVGDMLDTLGPRWDVLHVVPIDGGAKDIDHLVIGPPGVFSITTESFPGQEIKLNGDLLTVGTQRFDDVSDARSLGESAAELLSRAARRSVSVTPLLVVVTPTKLGFREQPAGVTVVSSRHLLHHLNHLAPTLSGEDVASISDVAEQDTTWQSTPAPILDVHQLGDDFDSLRAEVLEAMQIRAFWGVAAGAIAAFGIWAAIAAIVHAVSSR